jgi:hypothetical protein
MGKAHAVAMSSVGAIFNTKLRPRLEMVAANSPQSAELIAMRLDFDGPLKIGRPLCRIQRLTQSLLRPRNPPIARLRLRPSPLASPYCVKNQSPSRYKTRGAWSMLQSAQVSQI